MRDNFPKTITNEGDLDYYEKYLDREFKSPHYATFDEKLKSYIGCLIKIDCLIGNRLEIRSGQLLEAGEDFIIIKLTQSNQKMLIRTNSINFLTILRESSKNYIYDNSTISQKQCQY